MTAGGRAQKMNRTRSETHYCISTTAREARLCGIDPATGRDYEYRRQWIIDKVQDLAMIYEIDVLFFAITVNDLHLVLNNLPQVVASWSDELVVARAVRAYPSFCQKRGGGRGGPTPDQIEAFLANKEYIAEVRLRLADISWFMRQLNQYISSRANAEDGRSGHFWSWNFRSYPVEDDRDLVLSAKLARSRGPRGPGVSVPLPQSCVPASIEQLVLKPPRSRRPR